MTTCVNLQNPAGVIDKFGVSAAGSATEVDLIAAVTVPTGDEHHITDFDMNVGTDGVDTIFKLYRSADGSTWTQIGEQIMTLDGTAAKTLGTSHKIKAGEQWKVTGIQATIARMSVRVGGQAKKADVRD